MLSRWPIRNKLQICVALLLLVVGALAFGGFRGAYAFRRLVRSISHRAAELPAADSLASSTGKLRFTLQRMQPAVPVDSYSGRPLPEPATAGGTPWLREEFILELMAVRDGLRRYREVLMQGEASDPFIGNKQRELQTVAYIEQLLRRVDSRIQDPSWSRDPVLMERLAADVEELDKQASQLPKFLQARMQQFREEVRGQYRTWIVMVWTTTVLGILGLLLLAHLVYRWIFRPLGVLISGSRRVASGDFQHRIGLATQDEMAELATAMNAMTDRFQNIRDDLDRQVKIRTREAVRSEQLASVGFLAAGVAHEINNPLASIAWCAESLESRLHDILHGGGDESQPELEVLRSYLKTIQEESFRCKGITESLLDFSRLEEREKQPTELGEQVEGVIDMVRHLGKYRRKNIVFQRNGRHIAEVNSQEWKQVVLNLITNALDSLDEGGTVQVELSETPEDGVVLQVRDDGCGMTEEVLEHLFEPFFTRRRDGQGTGLGLSITYRIVSDHGGTIEAASSGPGQGSQFRVTLPRHQPELQHERDSQAA